VRVYLPVIESDTTTREIADGILQYETFAHDPELDINEDLLGDGEETDTEGMIEYVDEEDEEVYVEKEHKVTPLADGVDPMTLITTIERAEADPAVADAVLDSEYTMNKQIRKDRIRRMKESVEIYETTAIDMPMLIAQDFVEASDVTHSKVWFMKEREVCRLVFMLPWGNDEAEMRFWNVLDKKRLLQKLITAGLVKGDIIHVHSFYEGTDDRFIRY
jgi:Domain of unknown function (DUF1967)